MIRRFDGDDSNDDGSSDNKKQKSPETGPRASLYIVLASGLNTFFGHFFFVYRGSKLESAREDGDGDDHVDGDPAPPNPCHRRSPPVSTATVTATLLVFNTSVTLTAASTADSTSTPSANSNLRGSR